MLKLTEQIALRALQENLPTKSGVLLLLCTSKQVPEIRNLLAVSLPEGAKFAGGAWALPGGEKIYVRDFADKLPETPRFDLVVCTGGEAVPQEQWGLLKAWRSRDVLSNA